MTFDHTAGRFDGLAHDSLTLDGESHGSPRKSSTRIGQHLFVAVAIAVVGSALALFAAIQLGVAPELAVFAGLGFAVAAGGLHLRIARPAMTAPKARSRRPVRRQPGLEGAAPSLDSSKPRAAADRSAPPAAIEPSDLALALLASLKVATRPPALEASPRGDAWTWELAAQMAPSSLAEPQLQPQAQSQVAPGPQSPAAPVTDVRETEFERVDRLVKRLADNVNQLQAMRQAQARGEPAEPSIPSGEMQLGLFPEPAGPHQQLEASINALRRSNAAPAVEPTSQPTPSWSKTSTPTAVDPQKKTRTMILQALNAQRIDVFLEPILDLADQRPQHYEVSIALRTDGGHEIDLAQAATDLSGTGLLPLIDQARLAKAAGIARRLADRGKAGAVFTELNGETLDDASFRDTFATDQFTMGAFPGQLVLTLSQAHVATFTAADWETLARLRDAGFGFALSDVTTLDMNFTQLTAAGFVFARLDAETFLIGLPVAGATVPPTDICRHLAASGLALIVGGIVEDHQLARIFGFGVLLGQGQLFGAPRPVKSDAASPATYLAAAASAAE